VDAEFFTFYAKGESGQLYSYYWESPYAYDGWNEVEIIPEYLSFCNDDLYSEPEILPPPFDISIESVYARSCSNWAGNLKVSLAVYHLLDSGEVLQWWSIENETVPLHMGYFGKLLLNSFISTVIGFAVGIYISTRIWRSTKF